MQPSGIRLKYRLRTMLLIGSLISLGGIAQESANTPQSRPEATKAALSCLLTWWLRWLRAGRSMKLTYGDSWQESLAPSPH